MKTEKRTAEVGESILVTKPSMNMGFYEEGDVLEVKRIDEEGVYVVDMYVGLFHHEYEVIVEARKTGKIRLSELEIEVKELKERLNQMELILAESSKITTKSASMNDQRKLAIELAYEKVSNRLKNKILVKIDSSMVNCEASFVVNTEKKTVVCLIKGMGSNKVYRKGIAKCTPEDAFNSDIGKVIALSRALNADTHEAFLNVVNPDKLAVGQIIEVDIRNSNSKYHRQVLDIHVCEKTGRSRVEYTCGGFDDMDINYKVVDDSNALY